MTSRLNAGCTGAILALAILTYALPLVADDLDDRAQELRASAEAARVEAAEAIRKDADEQRRQLEGRLSEIKQWTQAQFELGERSVIDKPASLKTLMKRWQEQHETEIYKYLQFPDKSRGEIESGRALNKLLTQIGPAAHQHLQTRRISESLALPLYEPTANDRIDDKLLSHLAWTTNTLGSGIGGRMNADGPLDIQWPPILREPRWADHCGKIETARESVLTELKAGHGVTPAADAQLRQAIGDLNTEYDAFRIAWIRAPANPAENRAMEYRRICDGRTHIQKLIRNVYAVVEGRYYEDVAIAKFAGGNVEEFLSYLHSNNLCFEKPTLAADRSAYHRVFHLMVRYYLDLKAVANLERHLELEIEQLKETSQEAIDVALGKTLSAADETLLIVEEMRMVRSIFDDE